LSYLEQPTESYILYPKSWDDPKNEMKIDSIMIAVDDPYLEFVKIHNNYQLKHHPTNLNPDGVHHTVIIEKWVKFGKGVCIDPYAVIGRDGFRHIKDENGNNIRLRHVGGVQIGDHVEIGANTQIDRGSFGDTIIGDYTKIDNNTHIAHNVKIGKNCILITNITIGGSVEIGDNVWIGMGAQIHQGLKIGDNAFIEMGANVTKDVPPNGRAKTEKARLGTNR
jgi:UDP-3-O-[3-hydroxymyristoyl] glucosamine N-acyltransferase